MSLATNCTHTSSTDSSDEVYILLAVTTATLSFFLNLSQLVVILHQRLLSRHKNLIIVNLCVCGQLSSATVLWHIYRILQATDSPRDDYLLCFLLPSGLHLLTLFTFAPLITLLVLQHHLVARPTRNHRLRDSQCIVLLLIVLAWCQAIIISIVPLTGWNEWHDVCAVPLTWSPSFAVLVCVLYFLHYPIIIIVLADLCLGTSKRSSSVAPTEVQVQERAPDSRSVILLLCLYAAGTMPFMCYTARVALWREVDLCSSLVVNEKAVMWTSWITVVFAALRPIFHVLVEDDLGDGTFNFITTVCRIQKQPYLLYVFFVFYDGGKRFIYNYQSLSKSCL